MFYLNETTTVFVKAILKTNAKVEPIHMFGY
jgi:hypothetical protein